MRYRALTATGDYTYGRGPANFLVDTPAVVAQAVQTRLRLFLGEWFVNLGDGVPWLTQVVGKNSKTTYDQVIRQTILDTEGVSSIVSYSSSVSPQRRLTITAQIETIYGPTTVTATQ